MLTLACSFAPRTSELAAMRAVLRPYLESLGVSPSGCDDMLLIATELASNAIEASGGNEIRLRARVTRDAVTVELDDDGAGFELPPKRAAPPTEQERGRGLWLARTLTNELTVQRRGGRTVVRAVRRLDHTGGRATNARTRGALAGQ
jgi:anti-sigma regulatory factor (Ser/Thr protein kinase)